MQEDNEEIGAIGNGIIEMIKNLITMMLKPMKKLIDMLMDNDEELRTQIAEIMITMNDRMNAIVSTIEVEQSTYMGLKLHDLELQMDETVEHHRMLKLMVEEVKRSMTMGKDNLNGKLFHLEETVNQFVDDMPTLPQLDVMFSDIEEKVNDIHADIEDKVSDLDNRVDEAEDSRNDNESNIAELDGRIEEIEIKLGSIGDILG